VLLDAAFSASAKAARDGKEIVDAVCRGDSGLGLTHITISPTLPIIAVGAPVRIYYPEIGRRLKCEVVFPDHCEVANAVGAAAGVVALSITVEVAGNGDGTFRVYGPYGAVLFERPQAALDEAQHVASSMARAAVIAMGAGEPEIVISVDKRLLPDAVDENGLFAAMVTARAIGRPVVARHVPSN
jgi:hypothetical protein